MTVSTHRRIVRDRILREAEGYLELLMAGPSKWDLRPAVRDPVAQRVLDALQRLDKSEQYSAYALYLRGLAYRAMERYHDAIPSLRQSAEQDPEDTHALLALGWCYKRIGRLNLAIGALQEALAVDDNQAIVHYNLACYWSLAGNAEIALDHLATAFQIDPKFRDLAAEESDFDAIRQHPGFRELTSVVV
ncbi:MAG TPA: tetratricopeptide repeat protein [Candidatus Anammoximicrobium sp.]|nr:tetratricopeptide repeat protein [Candidatus Anammoximicrobium sp.]